MSRFNDNPEGIYDPTATLAIEHVIHEQKTKPYRPFVYVCSRYSGDIQTNTAAALRYCQFAVKRGCIPIASHIFYAASGILDENDPDSRSLGLTFGLLLLDRCSEVWIFSDGTLSEGMRAEYRRALRKEKRIRTFNLSMEETESGGFA